MPGAEPASTLSFDTIYTITTGNGSVWFNDTGVFDGAAGLFAERMLVISGTVCSLRRPATCSSPVSGRPRSALTSPARSAGTRSDPAAGPPPSTADERDPEACLRDHRYGLPPIVFCYRTTCRGALAARNPGRTIDSAGHRTTGLIAATGRPRAHRSGRAASKGSAVRPAVRLPVPATHPIPGPADPCRARRSWRGRRG